jgi:hypothetical protein
MKGVVFSEFIEMVESQFSPETADEIILAADLASGGMYTSVGTYDHGEMLALVSQLSSKTSIPSMQLMQAFGAHLFGRFVELYPAFFDGVDGTFDFLSQIEDHVHVEVRKLYPDAELPTFDTSHLDPDTLEMVYRSGRPFADLALGLIRGCADHYNEHLAVEQLDLSDDGRTHVRFTLRRQ